MTRVLFFSDATSAMVCSSRSCSAPGVALMAWAGLGELGGGLELAVGVDHPCAAVALGLGLTRHRPAHALGQGHVLDLDPLDADAPVGGGRVDDRAEFIVDLLAVRKQRV